ncbi:hypothetical protein BGZ63DRAFT_451750 [Mariannaea sp. PMI_226]|nr:hypothetical protein BGZ63DRAFT_451750 [Mariannaea sp. PMI_226]
MNDVLCSTSTEFARTLTRTPNKRERKKEPATTVLPQLKISEYLATSQLSLPPHVWHTLQVWTMDMCLLSPTTGTSCQRCCLSSRYTAKGKAEYQTSISQTVSCSILRYLIWCLLTVLLFIARK